MQGGLRLQQCRGESLHCAGCLIFPPQHHHRVLPDDQGEEDEGVGGPAETDLLFYR